MKSILNCQQIWITMMLCWISSVVFVRCTPLALSAGKKRKIEKKIFFSFSARTHVLHFFFCIPFPREKREKTFFFLFFFLCPDEKSFFFFLFSDEKSFFFYFFLSLPERTRVFFVSAYLFPAKKREKSFFFSFSARTHKRVRARKTTRAIQLRKLRKVSFREENKSFPPGLSVWRKTNKKLFFKKVCFWKEKKGMCGGYGFLS